MADAPENNEEIVGTAWSLWTRRKRMVTRGEYRQAARRPQHPVAFGVTTDDPHWKRGIAAMTTLMVVFTVGARRTHGALRSLLCVAAAVCALAPLTLLAVITLAALGRSRPDEHQ